MKRVAQTGVLSSPGLNGWVEAGLFVVAISILNIVYAVASQAEANFMVFALYSTAFASVGLLMVTGFGAKPMDVIRSPHSWFYGIAAVAMEAAYFLLLATVSPAEASLTVRLAIPASFFIGWLVFSRSISLQTLIGLSIVIAAVVPIFSFIPIENRLIAIVLAITCAVVASLKTFASEFHPQNRMAATVIDKLRVTGLVVLATAVVGIALFLPLSLLAKVSGLSGFGVIPPLGAYVHVPTVLLSVCLGAPVLLAMNYLTLSSAVKITTENFLATSAFTPLGALVAQYLAAWAGLIVVPPFEPWLLALIALGIVGVMILIRRRPGAV